MRASAEGRFSCWALPPLLIALAFRVVLGLPAAPSSSTPPLSFSSTYRHDVPLGLDLYLPSPPENPLSPEKILLGRKLFFDPRLSHDESMSCASCHDPARAFTDGRPVSVGVSRRRGTRSVPTLVGSAYEETYFWDGRTSNLEEQVLQPILNRRELDMTLAALVVRLNADAEYRAFFRAAFGREADRDGVAKALASYVRTILSGRSPVDLFLYGGEPQALSPSAQRGFRVFRDKANCAECHRGPNFTDGRFHNTGVAWRDGWLDEGRFLVTGRKEDRGAFKAPTLREVARTAPYMHDGSLRTLEEVIEFYDRGGNPNPNLDPAVRPLSLTADEKAELLEFLRSLSGQVHEGVRSLGDGERQDARRDRGEPP